MSPLLSSLTMLLLQELRLTPVLLAVTVLAQLTAGSQVIMPHMNSTLHGIMGRRFPDGGLLRYRK